jgi:PASTA domain
VRTARRHGKSWAEIATKLGVTRQSAWERWRDLDDAPSLSPTGSLSEAALATVAAEITERAARERRRRATVVVPHLIGLSWHDARHAVQAAGLFAAGPDPDGPPLATLGGLAGVVTDQSPESGAKVPPGSTITLWLEGGDGGSAGVREPRRPKPTPKQARELRYETSDEAVG